MRKVLFFTLLLPVFAHAQIDTLYFNGKWKQCSKDTASYFRVAHISVHDALWDITDYYMNGKVQMVGSSYRPDLDICEGPTIYYDSAGLILSEGEYHAGRKYGKWIYYYKNSIKSIVRYEKGKLNGFCEYYFPNKYLKSKGKYEMGKRKGKWKFYFRNGAINAIENYDRYGLLSGNYIGYDSISGKTVLTGTYDSGKRIGEWKYNIISNITIVENYKNGKLNGQTMWYDSINNIIAQGYYVNGFAEGVFKAFYKGGREIKLIMDFHNGSLNGLVKSYYQGNTLKRIDSFYNGEFISGKCYSEWGDEIPHFPISSKATFSNGDPITYIGNNLRYPQDASKANIEGKVIVSFIVNEDGSLSDAQVEKGIFPSCDEEAKRLIIEMPKWIPAQIDGVPFKTKNTLPVVFWQHEELDR